MDKFIHQDHMTGAADGKPLCDALHNPKQDYFQILYDTHLFPFLRNDPPGILIVYKFVYK